MKYVHIDPNSGAVTWDAYFEYLRSERLSFSSELYSYASDWEKYSLDGENSLHDSWLIGVQFGFRESDVCISLLGARHDRKHVLRYTGVQGYEFKVSAEVRSGDRDLLAHEFRIESGFVVHELVFSNRSSIVIKAGDVLPRVETLS
jgi:hypothetical protein